MINNIILFFFSLIITQDWQPFHSQELERFSDFQIDYQSVDDRARVLDSSDNRNLLTHEIIGYLPYWEYDEYPDLDYNLLTQINFFSAELNANGDIINSHNWLDLNLIDFAHERGVKVKLCATLFGEDSLETLLDNYFYRQNAINNLLNLVISKNADGVDIDFELLPTNQRENLVLFMEELSFAFHLEMEDPIITMATPAIDWSNAWDYEALAEITDGLFIMGYNYFYSGSSNAGPVSPLGGYFYDLEYTVNDYIDKTNGQYDKIILGLPYYGYDWPVIDNSINSQATDYGIARTYASAHVISESYGYNWDSSSNSLWTPYQNSNWQQCWYEDSLSLSNKYEFAKDNDLQGVGIWALGYDDDYTQLWGALESQFLDVLFGDINLDGQINIQDIIVLVNIVIENIDNQIGTDFNNDSQTDILDIIILVNIILEN